LSGQKCSPFGISQSAIQLVVEHHLMSVLAHFRSKRCTTFLLVAQVTHC